MALYWLNERTHSKNIHASFVIISQSQHPWTFAFLFDLISHPVLSKLELNCPSTKGSRTARRRRFWCTNTVQPRAFLQHQVGGHISVSNDWQYREAFMEGWAEDALQMVDSEAVAVETRGPEVLRAWGGCRAVGGLLKDSERE